MPVHENYPAHAVFRRVAEASITQWAAVVEGTSDGQCNMPGGADVGLFLGFAMNGASAGEEVQIAGPGCYSRALSDGTVTRGAQCSIAGTSGKIKAVTTADTYVVASARSAGAVDGNHVWVRVLEVNNT